MHLFHVDFLKNVEDTATCYAASTFESRAQRVVCQLNLAFIAAVSLLHPPFNLMPAVPGESLPPPPLLAQAMVLWRRLPPLAAPFRIRGGREEDHQETDREA